MWQKTKNNIEFKSPLGEYSIKKVILGGEQFLLRKKHASDSKTF